MFTEYGSAGLASDENGESVPALKLNLSRNISEIAVLWILDP